MLRKIEGKIEKRIGNELEWIGAKVLIETELCKEVGMIRFNEGCVCDNEWFIDGYWFEYGYQKRYSVVGVFLGENIENGIVVKCEEIGKEEDENYIYFIVE